MTFPCKAATVWSDDFDDEDYDGWTVVVGSFSIEENTLEAGSGDDNLVYHPSSVATGTWSFDVSPGGTLGAFVSFLCSDAAIDQVQDFTQIDQSVRLRIDDRVIALWRTRDGDSESWISYRSKTEVSGWQHIDVTRDSDGRICVYQDGNLVIDTVETSITTSEFFAFWTTGEAPSAIDNIVVSNTIDILPPPPTPFYMQTWFLATVGIVVAIVAIVAFLRLRK